MKQSDLHQISQLLDEKLEEKLEEKFTQKLAPVHSELNKHGKMLASHGKMLKSQAEILTSHGKMLKSHGKMLKSLKKDQDTILIMLDKEQMDQAKRLKRVEDHLGLSSVAS